jgi:hypothetical protein
MPLKMSQGPDPQCYHAYRKLWRKAQRCEEDRESEEYMMVAQQALPPLRTPDQEFYWEYLYPGLVMFSRMLAEKDGWREFCQQQAEKERGLPPPAKLPGPPPSIHAVLGAALHQDQMTKRKRAKESQGAAGVKRRRGAPL